MICSGADVRILGVQSVRAMTDVRGCSRFHWLAASEFVDVRTRAGVVGATSVCKTNWIIKH